MIGSPALAEQIANHPWRERRTTWGTVDRMFHETPDGWSFLGEGSTRAVFLGPDGFVYKIVTYNRELLSENFYEAYAYAEHAERLTNLSDNAYRLAECEYFEASDVLAMEYCEPTGEDIPQGAFMWLCTNKFGGDLTNDNYYMDSKGLVLIDYAHLSYV